MTVIVPAAPATHAPVQRQGTRSTGDSFAATLAAAADDRAPSPEEQTGATAGTEESAGESATATAASNEPGDESTGGAASDPAGETLPWLQGGAELSPTEETAGETSGETSATGPNGPNATTDETAATAPTGVVDPAAAAAHATTPAAAASAAATAGTTATGTPAGATVAAAGTTPTAELSATTPGAPAQPAAQSGSPATPGAPATGIAPPAGMTAAAAIEATSGPQIDPTVDADTPRPVLAAERPTPGAEATVRAEALQPTTRAESVARPAPAQAPAAPVPQPPPLSGQLATALSRLTTAPEGHHVLNILVDPEDLGPVRVSAHIGAEGVRIELTGMTDAARDSLRGALSELRRELAATGLHADLDLASDDGPAERPQHARPTPDARAATAPTDTPTDPRVAPLGGRGLDLLA